MTGFDPHRLSEEQPEEPSEDHFFHQKCDCNGKDQARDHRYETDDELHMSFSLGAGIEWQSVTQTACY